MRVKNTNEEGKEKKGDKKKRRKGEERIGERERSMLQDSAIKRYYKKSTEVNITRMRIKRIFFTRIPIN